jgi:hypothetical protein
MKEAFVGVTCFNETREFALPFLGDELLKGFDGYSCFSIQRGHE